MSAGLDEPAGRLVARHGDRVLFEYVFRPALERDLAPRPYFHPLRSLGGTLLTDFQPGDHRWHLGLSYSWPVVDGGNFWGGPTFVRDRGYVGLDNHGETRHVEWRDGEERLDWIDRAGARLIAERRTIGQPEVDVAAGAWSLELESELENVAGRAVRLGSPTTEGRPMAGYAGLFWRGPESMRHGRVLVEDGAVDGEAMGLRSRWLGYAGGGATVAFVEDPANHGVPNRWFVRTEEYPVISSSPVFDEALELAPGATLRLRHRLLFADGEWDAGRLRQAAAGRAGTAAAP
jgi:hypothetical protein